MINRSSKTTSIRDGTKTDKIAGVTGAYNKASAQVTNQEMINLLGNIDKNLTCIKELLTMLMEKL